MEKVSETQQRVLGDPWVGMFTVVKGHLPFLLNPVAGTKKTTDGAAYAWGQPFLSVWRREVHDPGAGRFRVWWEPTPWFIAVFSLVLHGGR